ncbi:MAG: hypothetical protein R3A48_00775 [Polyangiales bacterium]
MSDLRPALAAALRALATDRALCWVMWQGERLLLAPVTDVWLAAGVGDALLAAGRGYRVATLTGRRQRYGKAARCWWPMG